MKIVNLKKFFEEHDFIESIILEFSYHADNRLFVLVVDYVNWELKRGTREFKKLIFYEVKNINRLWSEVDTNYHIGFSYSIKEHQGIYPLQDIEVKHIGELQQVRILSSYNFGGLEFESMGVTCESRVGLGKQISKDKWNYIDVNTNEEFSFEHPFGRILH